MCWRNSRRMLLVSIMRIISALFTMSPCQSVKASTGNFVVTRWVTRGVLVRGRDNPHAPSFLYRCGTQTLPLNFWGSPQKLPSTPNCEDFRQLGCCCTDVGISDVDQFSPQPSISQTQTKRPS